MFFLLGLIIDIILAGIAGAIAGEIMSSQGNRLYDVLLGIVGGVVGNAVFRLIGFAAHTILSGMIVSVIGACIVIALVRKFGTK